MSEENTQVTFNDVFSSNFLDKASSFSILDTLIGLGLALVIGLFIFLVYKKTFKGVMYSETFGVSLIAMSMITSLIIMAITSNIVLSLGMVGALSIVRFRSAIKEPMDIAFLFWAIASGIVVGAGLILLGLTGSAIIGIFMIIFTNKKTVETPYVLVVNCNDQAETVLLDLIKKSVKKHIIKSKSISKNSQIELTVEIRLNNASTKFVNEICQINGVSNAVLVSYNGEYMS